MTLTINDRFEINALIETLVENGPTTFDAAKAQRLIELVPLTRNSMRIVIRETKTGSSSKGYAAGVGNVELDGQQQKTEKIIGRDEVVRVGGYKLRHSKGQLEIELMWAETHDDGSGQSALLCYNKAGVPLKLQLLKQYTFGFSLPMLFKRGWKIYQLGLCFYVAWKTPA